jgi:pilus assembly protein CpaC
MINGKAAGETSLIVWQAGGERQFFNVKVRPTNFVTNDRLETVRRELKTELPGQQLQVSASDNQIFLRGSVKDLNSSDRAVQIASTAGKVTNLLYVAVPPADPQILLKVRFASFDRTRQNQLGMNLFSTGAANTIGSVTTQQFSPPSVTTGSPATGSSPATPAAASLSNLLNLFVFRPDINLGATIEALQNDGVLQVLAEPDLLTANGKEGSFLAGGEYPYPVIQGVSAGSTGAVTIQFKEFGVRLNFIPTITPRGTIRLQVAPEVSSLDFANGITISGFTVPSLSTRKVNTEVELSEGQSFAIGGLLDNRETSNFSKIPYIGDLPVLGKFFQSISKTLSQTELIVIVTPVLVRPAPKGIVIPGVKYPDKFIEPNTGTPMTGEGPEAPGVEPPNPATMPVERLVDSLQPEQPLIINSLTSSTLSQSSYAASQSSGSSGSAPVSSAPAAGAP